MRAIADEDGLVVVRVDLESDLAERVAADDVAEAVEIEVEVVGRDRAGARAKRSLSLEM